ncbi:MAG: hypothetical protein IJI49_04200 [Bacilli bacterium]|nr:hypothetical protein [Bacilli bacterium]
MIDKIGMNVPEIELLIDKLKIYIKEEDISVDELDNLYLEINKYYQTNNTNKIDLLESELVNNLKKISKIHNNNILVLEKKVEEHKELERENKMILSGEKEVDIDGI